MCGLAAAKPMNFRRALDIALFNTIYRDIAQFYLPPSAATLDERMTVAVHFDLEVILYVPESVLLPDSHRLNGEIWASEE